MKNNIFIPTKINVGFQERKDTYTQRLAYVVYYDQNNKLRKEASWNSWRDNKIEPIEFDNIPTSGFVLNKKVGGYSTGWNHRQTYARIYDSRGFEFEITVPNLLYILENTNSLKGKGLEGEFVYGWDSKDLILIPTSSPDYKELVDFNDILHKKEYIKSKDLIVGATYKDTQNRELIYMGRFDKFGWYAHYEGKQFFFYEKNNSSYDLRIMKSISGKIIEILDKACVFNYAELFDRIENNACYSPIDDSKDEYVKYTFEEFCDRINKSSYSICFSSIENNILNRLEAYKIKDNMLEIRKTTDYWNKESLKKYTREEAYNKYKPMHINKYLQNGRFYRSEK